jgi:hypothetical protein
MSSSSAAVRISSSDAQGWTWDCPALAFFSSARNSFDTVMCMRLSFAFRGSTVVRSPSSPRGAIGDGRPAATAGAPESGGASSTVELWPQRVPCGAATAEAATVETTVRLGITAEGAISAATCLASWRESPKNRGRTSLRFSSVITRASSMTVVKQRRPSRTGSSTSGNCRSRREATIR